MDHTKAVSEHSAERYLLGELPAAEAEAFERHYFECEECTLALEAGQVFVANARAVMAAEPQGAAEPVDESPPASFWDAFRAWFTRPSFAIPSAAAAAFALIAVYQGAVQIPALHRAIDSPRALPAFQLLGASRGEGVPVRIPRGTPAFSMALDIPPDAQYSQYICELTMGGRTLFRIPAAPPAAGMPITILAPAKDLLPGTYELAIYGADSGGQGRNRVSTSTFNLEYY